MPPEQKPSQGPPAQPGDNKLTDGLQVKIYAPFKTYFAGAATSVSAVNRTGPFDVLAKHHNFITLLTKGDVRVKSSNWDQVIPIDHGIMYVKKNIVTVFLDF